MKTIEYVPVEDGKCWFCGKGIGKGYRAYWLEDERLPGRVPLCLYCGSGWGLTEEEFQFRLKERINERLLKGDEVEAIFKSSLRRGRLIFSPTTEIIKKQDAVTAEAKDEEQVEFIDLVLKTGQEQGNKDGHKTWHKIRGLLQARKKELLE